MSCFPQELPPGCERLTRYAREPRFFDGDCGHWKQDSLPITLCKHEAGLCQQLGLFQTYHNFILPHASLRLSLPELEPIPGTGAIKRWQPRTPAMAAGLTDRVWSLREVLLYRVPP